MEIINRIPQDHPILVDKYLQGKEIEVDAVCDGTDILIPGIMEHIERAGVTAGRSWNPAFLQNLVKQFPVLCRIHIFRTGAENTNSILNL